MAKFWKNAEGLGGVVSRSLVQMIKIKPGEGWIRARFASDSETILKLRQKIDNLEEANTKLSEAMSKTPPKVDNLAFEGESITIRYYLEGDVYSGLFPIDKIFYEVAGELLTAGQGEYRVIASGIESYLRLEVGGMVDVLGASVSSVVLQFSALNFIEYRGDAWCLTPLGLQKLYEGGTIKKNNS